MLRSLALLAVSAVLPLHVSARATQILEIHPDSLTSYLPSAASAVQDARPQVLQRGTGIDGSLRAQPGLALACAGNPFENVWVGKERHGDVRLDVGAYAPFDVDLALPAPGFRWVVGRTYNPVQKQANGSHRDSNGYQGVNWFQVSQPALVFFEATNDEDDLVYLVYGADRFLEFRRFNEESEECGV